VTVVPREKLRKFPHMMPNDIAIWERFLIQNPDRFYKIEYDVRVGKGRGTSKDFPDWKNNLSLALTRFRIDAIGWTGLLPTIIEVKPYIQLSGLGQLKGYKYFWDRENAGGAAADLLAVTDKTTDDIRELYDYYEIELIEVGSTSL